MKPFGFFDTHIREMLIYFPEFIRGFDCLLTCFDSHSNTTGVTLFEDQPEKRIIVGSMLGVSGNDLLSRLDIFDGFDALLIFRKGLLHTTDRTVKIDRFTSEAFQFINAIPPELEATMSKYNATRFCSDGAGLNIVLEDPDLFARIEKKFHRLDKVY